MAPRPDRVRFPVLKTLYGKLAIALLGLLLTVAVAYTAFSLYSTRVFLQELNQRFNRDLARQLVVDQDPAPGRAMDEAAVAAIFGRYMHINPAIEIYLLDAQGRIVAFEAPDQKIKRRSVSLDPILRFLSDTEAFPILGDDPRDVERRKIFSVASWPLEGEPQQYLYVVLGGEEYANVQALLQRSQFLQISTTAVAASVLLTLLAGLFIFNLLTRRLRRLSGAMEAFRASGFRTHTPYGQGRAGGDEIDSLGATFDEMAARIVDQVQALEEKDTLRRNLVANVSHDLRTPLASMRGYLETLLLKSDQFSPEERRQHLATAFKHSERMSRLVQELFELSNLEAMETRPEREPVALGELVQDVAQKFRLRAEQNGNWLRTRIPPNLPFVAADIGLLERVLENLIENAIVHTPRGGHVELVLEPLSNGARTTVVNTGSVISPEDLPHVFERFYQAPDRRSTGGVGLGLAIVHRILEAHGSTISVSSTAETGTAFSFVLPEAAR